MAATSASPTLGHTEEDISTTVGADFKVGLDNSPELLHEFNFSMRHKRPASPIQKPNNGSFDMNLSLILLQFIYSEKATKFSFDRHISLSKF